MTIPPPPSGHDIYWEKWMDAFEEVQDDFPMSLQDEEELTSEPYDVEEDPPETSSMVPVQGVMTPYGMLPITDDTLASRKFKFWVGHSNFRLTEAYYNVIGPTEGVETLDILTPYRFRIGVGKMFVDRNVMVTVRDKMIAYVGEKKKETIS
tara:strand:- start:62 stop:514 length:453 start_codon:yes stop_codon:yes gene_type:complete